MIPDQTAVQHINPNDWGTENTQEPTKREYQAWRNAAYECLVEAGFESEADDFLACAGREAAFTLAPGQTALPEGAQNVYVCSEHTDHTRKVVFPTCHLRICPDCAHRDVGRLMARYYDHIKDVASSSSHKLSLKKIVLTTGTDLRSSSAASDVINVMASVPKLFDTLLPDGWRSRQGILAAYEFGTDGHKLHVHVLFYGQYIPKDKLSEAWESLSGFPVTYIKAVTGLRIDDAIAETLKYTTKFWSRNPDGSVKYIEPELVPRLLDVLKGTRRIRTAGIFYGVPFEREPSTCPDCSAELKRVNPSDWLYWLETGHTQYEHARLLDLKPGNKSPPDNSLGHDPPTLESSENRSQQQNQLVLSDEFKPVKHKKGYWL
jgi:hypothetical protein